MKRIDINEWSVVQYDELNWFVAKPLIDEETGAQSISKEGHPQWKRKSYFPKLELALVYVLTKRIEANVRDDMRSVLHAIDTARLDVINAVNGEPAVINPTVFQGVDMAPGSDTSVSVNVPMFDIG